MIKEKSTDTFRDSEMQFEEVKQTTIDGKEIIPFYQLEEGKEFIGTFLENYFYPDSKTYEKEKNLPIDDRESFKALKFKTMEGNTVLLSEGYRLNQVTEGKSGYVFKITFTGNKKIANSKKSVKEYRIQVSNKKG